MKTRSKRNGFTLVEILIVVVILGILAAIVIPQFSQASSEARESSVKSNLQMVRSQIELYKIQHNDDFPVTAALLVTQLTTKTDIDGNVPDVGEESYGPYMKKFPVNAINNYGGDATEIIEATTDPVAVGADVMGWYYNTDDGGFFAIDDEAGDAGDEIYTW